VAILTPEEGSVVADTVRVAVSATDDGTVARVTLLVDQATYGTRFAAPWVIPWSTGALPDSSLHALQAVATDQAGNLALSAARQVLVRRNSPPQVIILQPHDQLWIDHSASPAYDAWRCLASDPDEGPLAGGQILWFLDGAELDKRGCSIAPPPLSLGQHQLLVMVTDAWRKTARATCSFTLFQYPECADPASTLEGFFCALRARDPTRARCYLAEDFVLRPPDPGDTETLQSGPRMVDALEALLADTCLAVFAISGRAAPPECFSWEDRMCAKIEIRALSIYRAEGHAASLGEGAENRRETRIESSTARIFLSTQTGSAGDASWRILSWWDLHRATWSQARGPSWSRLLTDALGSAPGS
jgi:hypothetical protein